VKEADLVEGVVKEVRLDASNKKMAICFFKEEGIIWSREEPTV
jgi:hypothetical protein